MGSLLIIGAGLAGAEAAWQAACAGIEVEIWEMRPQKLTPAHSSACFAELVCSNSLGSNSLNNASGLLKEELRRLGSLIMRCADKNHIPAGDGLSVDRERFARAVTVSLKSHPLVTVVNDEAQSLPKAGIIATGPLTSFPLTQAIQKETGGVQLYFYDAASPIVTTESVNLEVAFGLPGCPRAFSAYEYQLGIVSSPSKTG